MRLGIFGGTFDPIHYGHLLLAETCRQQQRLERVYFLPAATPPHKQGVGIVSPKLRVQMIELAIAGNEAFFVSPYECDRGGVNYTVDTLTHFGQEFPTAELFFLMGADMLHDLPNWRQANRVCELALPIVVRRPGAGELRFDCLDGVASPERIEDIRRHQVVMPEVGFSSTELRQRIAAGQSIRYQTPRAVEAFIAAHGLYRTNDQTPNPND